MSGTPGMPVVGNKILVPASYSHKEVDPEDEYYVLVDIHNPGDGLCYYATRLMGGNYGTVSTDEDDTMEMDLEEFRLFRGFYMRKK